MTLEQAIKKYKGKYSPHLHHTLPGHESYVIAELVPVLEAARDEIKALKESAEGTELEAMNRAINFARSYIESDRQEKREWKGWTLDEFDQACEDLDTIRAAKKGTAQ